MVLGEDKISGFVGHKGQSSVEINLKLELAKLCFRVNPHSNKITIAYYEPSTTTIPKSFGIFQPHPLCPSLPKLQSPNSSPANSKSFQNPFCERAFLEAGLVHI